MEESGRNGYNNHGITTGGGNHDRYLKGPAPIITVDDNRGRNRVALALIVLVTAFATFYFLVDKVPIYIKLMETDIPAVKAFAAAELGDSKDERAIQPLASTFTSSKEPAVWEASMKALLKIGSVCLDGSPRGNSCPDREKSKTVTPKAIMIVNSLKYYYGEIKDNRYRERLSFYITLGLKEKSVDVRILAAQLLSHFGRENAVGPLTEALKDDDPRVRSAAKISIDFINERIAKATPKPPGDAAAPEKPSDSVTIPAEGTPPQPKRLHPKTPELGSPPALSPSKTFSDLEVEFKELGKSLAPPFNFAAIVKDLESEDPNVRARAAMTLAYLKHKYGTVYVLPLLKDKEKSVRIRAEFSLGVLNNFASVRPLLDAYKIADEEEKLVIFHSLLKMDDPLARKVLSEVSAGDDPTAAKIAAAVLYFGKGQKR